MMSTPDTRNAVAEALLRSARPMQPRLKAIADELIRRVAQKGVSN